MRKEAFRRGKTYLTFTGRSTSYLVADVSQDPTWDDVKVVVDKRDIRTGQLLSVVNHRDTSFDEVCAAIRLIVKAEKTAGTII